MMQDVMNVIHIYFVQNICIIVQWKKQQQQLTKQQTTNTIADVTVNTATDSKDDNNSSTNSNETKLSVVNVGDDEVSNTNK